MAFDGLWFSLGEERFFHANAATLPARAHRTLPNNKVVVVIVDNFLSELHGDDDFFG